MADQRPGQLSVPLHQPTRPTQPPLPPSSGIVVFSGGSAANNLVDVFERVRDASRASLSYVLPISDNGGSTSEIIRVFGGPGAYSLWAIARYLQPLPRPLGLDADSRADAPLPPLPKGIGDVRSRLVRLIPDNGDPESAAIKKFFNHRLPDVYDEAQAEWIEILGATHPLWNGVSSPKRELIRSHLNVFNLEVVKRTRPGSRFDFSRSSIGNLFLTGARLFTGSFEAAIYLLSSVCAVPDRVGVLPALNTNFAHHIAAGLSDGSVITGQNDISHPSAPSTSCPGREVEGGELADDEAGVEDANLPGSLAALRRPAISFSKEQEEELPARIERIWYINPYGQEIRIPANARVLEAMGDAATVIYSIGSLFTSLVPNLILKGVGEAIASPRVRNKILILNGTLDRETGPGREAFSGLDFVATVARACADSRGLGRPEEDEYGLYVTHVIYLQAPGAPTVDKQQLSRLGIDSTRLYGPRDGRGGGGGGRYDATALAQTLESIIGRQDGWGGERSRRNTLVG